MGDEPAEDQSAVSGDRVMVEVGGGVTDPVPVPGRLPGTFHTHPHGRESLTISVRPITTHRMRGR